MFLCDQDVRYLRIMESRRAGPNDRPGHGQVINPLSLGQDPDVSRGTKLTDFDLMNTAMHL